MSHLLEIERQALQSANVINFDTAIEVRQSITNSKKEKFNKSLQLGEYIHKSLEWYGTADAKQHLSDSGVDFGTTEEFINRVFGMQKSFAYKLRKAYRVKIDSPNVLTKYKRACTTAENNGSDSERSIAGLLKFAKAEQNGDEANVQRAKTYATFSIAKEGVNGEKGFSVRLTEDGIVSSGTIEDENVGQKVIELFARLELALAYIRNNENNNQ